ncbi:MAG: DUF4351 domain-containing protein [Richelia sp.]|nr:DUF4351 domain-containing protein [Richelia sp.]CDN10598.1 hypothetical protein RintRC_6110 [Richelia intracellularis]
MNVSGFRGGIIVCYEDSTGNTSTIKSHHNEIKSLESLEEALLDFTSMTNLQAWLETHSDERQ